MTLRQFSIKNLLKDLQYLTLCPSSLNSDNILLTVLSLQSNLSVICFKEKQLFFSIISSKYSFLSFLSRYFIIVICLCCFWSKCFVSFCCLFVSPLLGFLSILLCCKYRQKKLPLKQLNLTLKVS